MYAVGMLGSYLTQGVYAVAGPFQPFGGAVDIIVVQQEDGTFKSSPWYVKFGDFQGVLKWQKKIVDISVNDVPADFHMILDGKGEAYFEKEVEPDEGTDLMSPDVSTSLKSSEQEGETENAVSTDTKGNTGLLAQEVLQNVEQEVEIERPVGTDSFVSISVVKNEMEESWETQQELVSGTCDKPHLKSKTGRLASNVNSQMSSETAESLNKVRFVEETCTEGPSSCMDVARTRKESGEEQEQATVASNDYGIGPENVRLASSLSNQMSSDIVEASNLNSSLEVTLPKIDLICTDNSSTFDSSDMEGSSSASQHSLQTGRGSDVGTILKEESVLHSTTIFAMEGSGLQAVTLSDAEVIEKFSGDSKSGVEDDSLLVDIWTEDTYEDLKADCDCKGNANVDASLDEDGVFASFKRVTIERESEKLVYSDNDDLNFNVPGDLGTHIEPLSWDFESPVNQGLGDDVFPPPQSSNVVPDEDSGNALSEKEVIADSDAIDEVESSGTVATISSPSKWRLWPLLLRWSRLEKASSLSNQALVAAANVAIKSPFTEGLLQKNGYLKWQQKTKVRTYVPTSAQLASLNLKDGPNKVTFTFSSVLGKTQVDARIYLWKWNTRIVISDVDGTITKSDVLGQVMPLVGRDWSQCGVTRLFSAIKDNGYEVLFLSARAISQAYLTRRFLLNLKQDGEALPEGPVFISPDGLIPSLYREVIRRAPHEFKISCLEGIRELFPKDVNPFYAGFGNRITDEISYVKVGIPMGKIFIINPKGEVVVNNRIDCKSYTSLHASVDEMFPPMSSHEQEEFNEWNFWKVPLPDIEDELSAKSSKSVKKVGSSKK